MTAVAQLGVVSFVALSSEALDAQVASGYLEVFKVIGGGLFVALLTLYIQSRHYRFDLLKESRRAYSEAKTGVDYLELRLSSLKLADAAPLLQQTHISKHVAELYPEVELHLRRRGIYLSPTEWGDGLYYRLAAARVLLEQHIQKWDDLQPADRLQILNRELHQTAARLREGDEKKASTVPADR